MNPMSVVPFYLPLEDIEDKLFSHVPRINSIWGPLCFQYLLKQGLDDYHRSSPQNDEALPPNTDFKIVDYNSLDSLLAALNGQDVVVSTVNQMAVPQQKFIIDAAIKAEVKRFIL
jgi:hypothetical protein